MHGFGDAARRAAMADPSSASRDESPNPRTGTLCLPLSRDRSSSVPFVLSEFAGSGPPRKGDEKTEASHVPGLVDAFARRESDGHS